MSENQCWLSLMVWLALLAWRFALWRRAAALLSFVVAMLLWRFQINEPEWRADMLDVGHGLAVVISRNNQALLYDTGGRWPGGNAGESIIEPWLRWHGLSLQQIILSHGHLDHSGGLPGLLERWPDVPVRSALGERGHLPCYRGTQWRWQKLNFTVLWPPEGNSGRDNNHSCVIQVSDGHRQLLLSGDLEAAKEYALITQNRAQLSSTVLQVGHHGSRTSSSFP